MIGVESSLIGEHIFYSRMKYKFLKLFCFSWKVLESYEWAYSNMVRVQQLSELEEVCILISGKYGICYIWRMCLLH